ncbi:aspartate--tRNA ligase [Flavobacterium sp. xlx-214]|uniref:aspartate--tRNA ligase n=1 Tax=unclassified Flavobacterium TaxID=196869 RepID=UPI0013D8836E|nr:MULTISPECIES: aspartate--tRNA ligase [unclassified Flavobacterium]MBA5793301.1 aspartate--tRNA ligase [Flavobacterium sp. xlx-221]QMI84135.1 aspartate--tRNA ligase [Flavobacterium sp. xlx-214]
MYRSHNCGELRVADVNKEVTLAGWVQKSRDKGFMIWVDLRDRYGITQLIFDESRTEASVMEMAKSLGREFVVQVKGTVIEREAKNDKLPTGAIEVLVKELTILNESQLPPFTIEDETDGGEDIRMKYRYLDIRRNPVKNSLLFRHKVTQEVRNYLSNLDFCEVETPYLIKSTPEGARDFVVPSRMNPGQFYALPQSPQTFKQLLMVGGMDKYFQIVKCFRDEDLRADRQPEFTQIDCEMSFIEQEDILNVFEGLTRHLLKNIHNIEIEKFPRMTFDEAMRTYGNDKPDIRFGMKFGELNAVAQHKEFSVFNSAELVVGIAVPGAATYTRKEIDALIDWVKRPQVGASGMVYVKCEANGQYKSSVDKFYDQEDLAKWAEVTGAKEGDLILVLSGPANKTRAQLSALRMELGNRMGLRKPDEFAPLWVVDFPLLEWDEDSERFHAMHHPFTSPKPEDMHLLDTDPGKVRANAYDLVLNGNEIGGGSIRIHDKEMQALMFKHLGFTPEQAQEQFGFLMNAFQYGAPPHGGLAFGLDRLTAILGGQETIRDFIAFPKNNSGRDVMIDAPATIDNAQLDELSIMLNVKA